MSALVFRSIKHVRDAFSESAFNTDTMACPRGDPIYRVPLLLIISLFMKMPQLLLKRRQVRRGRKKWRKPVLRDYFKNDNYHCPVSLTNVWYLYVRESGFRNPKNFCMSNPESH